MTSEGYVECLKYLIGESVQYYRYSKQKSYTGIMHRINMGCDIFPREKNFWDLEADKTVTIIDNYIYEMTVLNAHEARIMSELSREMLADIDYQCDAYRWYWERNPESDPNFDPQLELSKNSENSTKKADEDAEWNPEDYVIGDTYRMFSES